MIILRGSSQATRASLIAAPCLIVAALLLLRFSDQIPLAAQYVGVGAVAYLTGSVSWGYILIRLMRGQDIRDFGSGRTGMSNILRTAGIRAAATVFVLDCSKGILAVFLARYVIGDGAPEVMAGLVALCGHNWPVFLRFRGGRGILPGLGGLVVMDPWVALTGAVLFLLIVSTTRYLSLGSIVGTASIAVLSLALTLWWEHHQLYTIYAIAGGSIIIWQHRDNLKRIIGGTEPRITIPNRGNT